MLQYVQYVIFIYYQPTISSKAWDERMFDTRNIYLLAPRKLM